MPLHLLSYLYSSLSWPEKTRTVFIFFSFFFFASGCLTCILLCPPAICLSFSLSLSLFAHFQAKSKSRTNRFNNWMKKINKVPQSPPMAMMTTQMMKSPLIHKKKNACIHTYVYIHTYAYTRTCISRVSACPQIYFFCDAHLNWHPWRLHTLESVWSYITPQII